MNVEKEHSTLKEKQVDLRMSLIALMTREEVHILLALIFCSYYGHSLMDLFYSIIIYFLQAIAQRVMDFLFTLMMLF